MLTLYDVISKDGYIADKDGNEDFIPDELWQDFIDLCADYDAVVMGRKTYEAIQAYDQELVDGFEKLPIKKIVVSRDERFSPKAGYIKISDLKDIFSYGSNLLLTSGPTLNTFYLTAGLLDKVIYNELAVELGDGIKPFSVTPNLTLNNTEVKDGKKFNYYTVNK